jgi:hypothetical protein
MSFENFRWGGAWATCEQLASCTRRLATELEGNKVGRCAEAVGRVCTLHYVVRGGTWGWWGRFGSPGRRLARALARRWQGTSSRLQAAAATAGGWGSRARCAGTASGRRTLGTAGAARTAEGTVGNGSSHR